VSAPDPSSSTSSAAAAGSPGGVNWAAIGRGALVGLCVVVGASVVEAILDRSMDDFKDSGWIYPLFVAILVGYALGGYIAGRGAPGSPLTNGILAGVGAFVLWIPVRVLIWLARDEDKGLFTGHSPAIRPGQLLGHFVIAAALGLLGGWLGGRAAARARQT
jgi:hypothetical protein